MRRMLMLTTGVALTANFLGPFAGAPRAGDQAGPSLEVKPPWQRLLQGEDAKKAQQLFQQQSALTAAGMYADALKAAQELVQLRSRVQGADHYQTISARWDVEALRRAQVLDQNIRDECRAAFSREREAGQLEARADYKSARPMRERGLAACRKAFGEDHPLTAMKYMDLAANESAGGLYAEAEEDYRKALAIRRRALGNEHPDTASCFNNLATNLFKQGRYAEAESLHRAALAIKRRTLGEDHENTARSYLNVALCLGARGEFAGAEVAYRKVLAVFGKTLGEIHPDTALCCDGLAAVQHRLGRYAEAEVGFERALAIRRRALGDEHPHTAQSYYNLAAVQQVRGEYARAEASCKKALAIHRKALGEEHPLTAESYNGLALTEAALGKYAEAEENCRKALAIRRKTPGENHPDTAASYGSLAGIQFAQGKYAEAEAGLQRALAIYRRVWGDVHPDTAQCYSNLAACQSAQGGYAEGERGFRAALALYRKALGNEHPDAIRSYHNLAVNLYGQGRYADAEEGDRQAVTLCRKTFGDEHPQTAVAYETLALNLFAQGKCAEAEQGFRKALAIRCSALGEEHPDTAQSYSRLAHCLHAQGKYAGAEVLWLQAADRFGRARLLLARAGLDRIAKSGELSPLSMLAPTLARNGKPTQAWRRYEESLARGTWDELSARVSRPRAEQARQAELVARLQCLDQLVEKAAAPGEPSAEQHRRRDNVLTERRQAQDELDALVRHLQDKYGPAAGQVFDYKEIQSVLPIDAALVGWLDRDGAPWAADSDGEHWAFLLRARGQPAVIRLRGSGPDTHWAKADSKLPSDLRTALQTPSGDWRPLAERMRQQRLEPLTEHLAARDGQPAVRHLIVLPSTALAGVPAEAFAGGFTVSYALSGTLFAHLRKQPRVETGGLLALADPVFDGPVVPKLPAPPTPPGGLLVTAVAAGGNGARAGLKAGDVLLRYNGVSLAALPDLKPLPEAEDRLRQVAVSVWRDGSTLERQLRPGELGVALASDPAPQALAAKNEADRYLAKSRGGDDGEWPALPGTRLEAEVLHKLFADSGAESLLLSDSDASEQRLYDLAKAGDLGKYRYLHLATHGTVDDRFPLRSAIILSRDRLPDPGKQLDAGLPVFDGRLTAEEVLRQWHLNADLVTLSACQTALGKYEKGEGFVGFAQALLLAGSRSVCLSLWKVDDAATALLMGRFYENLLGKREGLKGPMPKAEALAEAKAWLRGLTREEAAQRAAKMSDGVARGKRPKLPPATMPEAEGGEAKAEGTHPYAHPYYWAAFVLIGDPD